MQKIFINFANQKQKPKLKLFEQNIDGLKRSLSTKSRRMSRITEIALVTNYFRTNPNNNNNYYYISVTTTTTTIIITITIIITTNNNKQQPETKTNLTFVAFALCSQIRFVAILSNPMCDPITSIF